MEVIDACGMTVMIDSVPVRQDQRWETIIPPGIWFGTVLEGELSVRTDFVGDTDWRPGATTRFKTQQAVATLHHARKDCVISGVFVRVAPGDMEAVMGGDALHLLERCPAHMGRVSDLARTVAWQMCGCTLSRPARRLYLTGKALEMNGRELSLAGCLRPRRAMRRLFGAPVYSFVKSRRLDEAKRMIEAGETSVSRVAQSFGYQPAQFSTEFKRRFGHAPSALIGRNKRNSD